MTIDERIEALTESVELLSRMHQDNEKRYSNYFQVVSDSLKTLTRLAEAHQNRLDDQQQRIDRLERP